MVESLANHHVDAFCVGAPWNSVAVDLGIGFILHFVSEILARAAEKVLAVRSPWALENPDLLARLVRAHDRAAAFIEDHKNLDEVAAILAAPNRIGVTPEVVRRTLDGRMKVAPDGTARVDDRYLLVGRNGASRPDPTQAAWLYAQMVRWGQAPLSSELLDAAKAVFRPDLFDAALGAQTKEFAGEPCDGIGAFAGPAFDSDDIEAHLAAWEIKRSFIAPRT
jgi:NitT/TauT family transport system ATP-binding protein